MQQEISSSTSDAEGFREYSPYRIGPQVDRKSAQDSNL